MLPDGGFILDKKQSNIEEGQYCYTLVPDKGEGYFWNYFYENMFVIEKQDFVFYEDFFLESPEPDFIAVQYFFSVSGEEFHPYRQLSPNSLRVYVGGNDKIFQAVYHKNIPIRSVSISIMPDFYNSYLRAKLCKICGKKPVMQVQLVFLRPGMNLLNGSALIPKVCKFIHKKPISGGCSQRIHHQDLTPRIFFLQIRFCNVS